MPNKNTSEVLESILCFMEEQRIIAQLEHDRTYEKNKANPAAATLATEAYYKTIRKAYFQLLGRIEGQIPYYR